MSFAIQKVLFGDAPDSHAHVLLCSLFTICGDACPFHASMLRPASQAGPMHEAGMGKLVNAALLSLINEA